MRYAIFSDIHSNLEALQAVLLDMSLQHVDRRICLGDIVGYNADPAPCLEIVRQLVCPVVIGNHDEAVTLDHTPRHFNPLAIAGVDYSREQLNAEQKQFLFHLPTWLEFSGFTVVHATLCEPLHWEYVMERSEAWRSFQKQKGDLCFIGHTHSPHIFRNDRAGVDPVPVRFDHAMSCQALTDGQLLVNVGSVGQSRDGDWRACYVIFDSEKRSIEFRRVSYDLRLTQNKIAAAGLPDALGQRLLVGR